MAFPRLFVAAAMLTVAPATCTTAPATLCGATVQDLPWQVGWRVDLVRAVRPDAHTVDARFSTETAPFQGIVESSWQQDGQTCLSLRTEVAADQEPLEALILEAEQGPAVELFPILVPARARAVPHEWSPAPRPTGASAAG